MKVATYHTQLKFYFNNITVYGNFSVFNYLKHDSISALDPLQLNLFNNDLKNQL